MADMRASRSWERQCYSGLAAHVMALSGEGAKDCGLLPAGSSLQQQRSITTCAESAVASGGAFRFGYSSFGDDSAYCHIAARSGDGTLWTLYYDNDVTGQLGQKGNNSRVSVSRCASIGMEPGTIGQGSFFAMSKCKEDAAREKSLFGE